MGFDMPANMIPDMPAWGNMVTYGYTVCTFQTFVKYNELE